MNRRLKPSFSTASISVFPNATRVYAATRPARFTEGAHLCSAPAVSGEDEEDEEVEGTVRATLIHAREATWSYRRGPADHASIYGKTMGPKQK